MKRALKYFCLVIIFCSCGSENKSDYSDQEIADELQKQVIRPVIYEKGNITLTELFDFPHFKDVSIEPMKENVVFRHGENKIEFSVRRLLLGRKTVAENELGIKVNERGQYLSLCKTKNGVVEQFYSSTVNTDLSKGDNNLLLFLCNSTGISLKEKASYTYINAFTNDKDGELKKADSSPFLLLNSPKNGEFYKLKSKVLVDFLIINAAIKKGNNYVLLKVNDLEFKIDRWSPFVIEGLPYGVHKISVEAFNAKGVALKGDKMIASSVEIEIKEDAVFE